MLGVFAVKRCIYDTGVVNKSAVGVAVFAYLVSFHCLITHNGKDARDG
jgi:hypothetical protein